MKYRNFILALFVVSVVGLAYVQYKYLQIGLNLAQVQFNQKVGQSVGKIKSDLYVENELTYLVGRVIEGNRRDIPLSMDSITDASQYFMKAYLEGILLENGVKADVEFRLYNRDSANLLISKGYSSSEGLTYPIRLQGYFTEVAKDYLTLELIFPHLNRYFLSQINGLLIPGLLFILFIIGVVIWVLRSFYWQRSVITTTNDFINNLTHELKTPVFSIGLATKILNEKALPEQKEMIALIRTQNDRLKSHIEKVLELAKLDKQKQLLNKEKVDFKPSLKELAEQFAALCKLENIQFEYFFEEGPYNLNAESAHLSNAISNLIENAIKYRDKASPRIDLKAYTDKKKLIIEIEDNGPGIKKDHLEKIFEKFYRVGSGDVHQVKGYGLGLYYVKQIIKMHCGRITLESAEGVGTHVTIVLPLLSKNF